MIYNKKLKEIRTYEDMKQTELASFIGISNAAYSEFEREKTTIPLKHLIKICDYFDVSLDYIFEFTTDKQYSLSKKEYNKDLLKIRLKELRKSNKLTQIALAKLVNTTHSVISDYENGKFLIGTSYLYELCQKFHISADYLLGRIDNPKYLKK